MKGLYVHIPFCESICHYCDFVKRIPQNQEMIDRYLSSLIEEINTYHNHFKSIETIYVGGGTPSMLSVEQLTRLFDALKDIHPQEYTIEVNPESYTKEKGKLFKDYGLNRISLGVQTFDQKLLEYLNRKHTKEHVFDVIHHLKTLDIPYISIDLIYAIPGQTLKMLKRDLAYIHELDITHVSCYSLILEEKTYFYHQYLKGLFHEMDQDMEATMYDVVIKELKKQGFEHYEISNYAKHGHYSKHNLIYWTLGEYIGVGLGAHGFVDGYRTYNHRKLNDYYQNSLDHKVFQTQELLLQDDLIFGLRKIKGVSIDEIESKYQIKLLEKYPSLIDKMNLGLVEIKEGRLKLTEKGIFLGNQVFMVFI
ncbi:MAG: radical SAM family heme chaperone HemW [Acholeplasmataceae bacterium]|nr:radical SAM family heme chaperone HemW [Acholeplasmataceae bacterium]